MAGNAVSRVHRELGSERSAPDADDESGWRAFLEPALTTAHIDDVLELIGDPADLKRRTIGLLCGVWEELYRDEFTANLPLLRQAAEAARSTSGMGFAPGFVELTGNRLPTSLVAGVVDVEVITFLPSAHLGSFISYTLIPPHLMVFFSAPGYLQQIRARSGGVRESENGVAALPDAVSVTLTGEELLEAFRALGDPNRLRILDLLAEGELYAQEIVGRLGIAQSAVSRHLSLLEHAGLVRVRPRGGMKYYALDGDRLEAVAEAIRARSRQGVVGASV
jgi:DNA-binding transcriptional ArsR family regulator